jgi:hypothetical protein
MGAAGRRRADEGELIIMPIAIVLSAAFISFAVIVWADTRPHDPLAVCIKKCWTNSCINNCGEAVRRSKGCQ